MKKLRLAVLVSGSGRTLQNLIDLQRAGDPWEIVLVIGSKYSLGGVDRAVAADIPTSVVERKSFDSVTAFSNTIFHLTTAVQVDLVVLAGWLSLLRIPPNYTGKVINIHPSLLPRFGGKGMYGHHVHTAVIDSGESESGCTVHQVNNEYDAGPVLLQLRCPVLQGDTPDTLAARVFEQERIAYPQVLRSLATKPSPP